MYKLTYISHKDCGTIIDGVQYQQNKCTYVETVVEYKKYAHRAFKEYEQKYTFFVTKDHQSNLFISYINHQGYHIRMIWDSVIDVTKIKVNLTKFLKPEKGYNIIKAWAKLAYYITKHE